MHSDTYPFSYKLVSSHLQLSFASSNDIKQKINTKYFKTSDIYLLILRNMRLLVSVPAILLVLGNSVLASDDLGCVCMEVLCTALG